MNRVVIDARRGLALACMLALALLAVNAGGARAASNTITATSITSPSDPSYFYDPTGGAFTDPSLGSYAGFTVTGTTNSTDPAGDHVDIDCYSDNGSSGTYQYTVSQQPVSLSANGSFSTFVPYSGFEHESYADPNGSACRLRAVPTGTEPVSALGSFTGPRVLLSYLATDYFGPGGTDTTDYTLTAPQLGATNVYTSASDCGLDVAYLNDPSVFGQADAETFTCTDASTSIEVDGNYVTFGGPGADAFVINAEQTSADGDLTISETDPLLCATCGSQQTSGVEEDRTIHQTSNGHVVEITDSFRSTDGAAHTLSFNVSTSPCFAAMSVGSCLARGFDAAQISYEFPGQTGYSPTPASGDTVTVGPQTPASIYIEDNAAPDGSTIGAQGAITYFTPPSGPPQFFYSAFENTLTMPYTLNVPAGGAVELSFAYSSEFSQAALAGDLQTALDLQSPPVISIGTPAPGLSTSTQSVTVSGHVSAATGVKSVTVNGVSASLSGSEFSASVPLAVGANTITAVVTTNSGVTGSSTETVSYQAPSATPALTPLTRWAGATWHPVAATGRAYRAGARSERLDGTVTPGSAAVSYYFQYGTGGHYNKRTRTRQLTAGKRARHVAFTIGKLEHGRSYRYRLVASGRYGHALGAQRSFKVAREGAR